MRFAEPFHQDAVFGHPGTRGLGTSRTAAIWPLVIGMRKSKELLYTGDNVSAREALQMGMINSVVPSDMLDAEVERIADRIAIQSADSLALQKRSVNAFYEAMGIHASVHADAGGVPQVNAIASLRQREEPAYQPA